MIEKFASRRTGGRGNFDEIEAGFGGHPDGGLSLHHSQVRSIPIDQLDFEVADFLVDARPAFRNGGWRAGRTNGVVSGVLAINANLRDFGGFVLRSDKARTLVPQAARRCNRSWVTAP